MDIFDKALQFAVEKHSGQKRKLNGIPYILHPVEVAAIVGTMTADKEVLSAAVLHDTVEDSGASLEEIEKLFSARVAALVASETEDKRRERPAAETWQIRKEESLRTLKDSDDIGIKMIWLGDKLSNMRSFARSYRQIGDDIWLSLHQSDPDIQAWYYFSVAKELKELESFDAYREYISLLNYVFKDHITEV